MLATIWIVSPTPPFVLIRPIRTATNIDRLFPLDEPGKLSFTCSPVEGVAVHDYASAGGSSLGDGLYFPPDLLREGAFLVDFSSELLDSALWYIQTATFGPNEASIQAMELRGLLQERVLPQGSAYASRGAPGIARALLAQANGRNPSWVLPGDMSGLQSIIPLGARTNFSGQDMHSAMDALAQFANCDWWIEYAISRQRIRPFLRLGRRGRDLRDSVHLTEGAELRSVSYSRDAREVPRFVRFAQSGEGAAGGVSTGSAVGYRTGGQVQEATQFHVRRALRKHGAALSSEQLRVYPQESADVALVSAALNSLQTSEVAVQAVELVQRVSPQRLDGASGPLVNPMPRTPWSAYGVGDIITARLSSPHFLSGADVTVRVTALQPDEAQGEMVIIADIVE